MKLERLHLLRAPGLPDGLELADLADGVNLLVGPNASGKTTFCRAARASLWPEEEFGGAVDADWRRGGERLRSHRAGSARPTWSADGGEVEPPARPAAHLRHCFGLELQQLLAGDDEAEAAIARALRLELTDGQDLAAALRGPRSARLRGTPPERRDFDEAQRKVAQVEARNRELLGEERELEELRARIAALREARGEVGALEAARALAEVRAAVAALELQRAEHPAGMERVPADLRDQRAERTRALRDAERELRASEGALAEARGKLDALGLGEQARAALPRALLRERVEELRALEARRDEAAEEAARLEAALERARAGLSGQGPPPGAAALERAALDRLDAALEEELRCAARLADARARAEAPEAAPRADADGARDGASGPGSGGVALAAALALLVALALLEPGAPARAVGAALALLLAGVGAWLLRRAFASAGHRQASAAEALRAEALRAQAAEALRGARAQHAKARADRDALLRELGLGGLADAGALGQLALARRLVELAAQESQRAGARGVLARAEAALAAALDAAAGLLASHGRAAAPDAAAARAALEALGDDAERARALAASLPELEDRRARAAGVAERERTRWAELYRALGLEPGDERGLDERAARHGAWTALSEALSAKRALASELESRLGARAALAERGVDALQAELDELEGIERELTESERRAAAIEARSELAREGDALERAQAELAAAREVLVQKRDELLFGAAADFLLRDVEAAHRRDAQPALVRSAGRRFARFTGARYALRATTDAGQGADDLPLEVLEGGRPKAFSALSGGTRAQLRIALRLAMAEAAEAGEPLPLFLDEALATSDPERFEAVVATLGALADEGRQVFYLTADGDEVQRFREALEGAGRPAPRVLELGAAARRASAGTPLAPRPRDLPPDPAGHDAASYQRALEAPGLDPFAPAAAAHLSWLLPDDLPALARMLGEGAADVGRAAALLERDWTRVWDEPARRRFRRRARALEAFLAAYGEGRGPALGEVELREGPLGRSSKIEAVVEVARELGGDARALLAALQKRGAERDERLKGLHASMIHEAERAWLEAGHLDAREPSDERGCLDAVAGTLQAELVAGEATLPELRELVAWWWDAVERRAAPGAGPG